MTIIYSTNAGSTERYAKMLSEKLSCEVVNITKSGDVSSDEEIIFMSWIMAGTLQNYAAAKENILDYFGYMADRTGTLWEYVGIDASCNHGFASYAICWFDKMKEKCN